jgi:hypothetical protein
MAKSFWQTSSTGQGTGSRSAWPWLITGGCLAVILLGLLIPRSRNAPANPADPTNTRPQGAVANSFERARLPHHQPESGQTVSAEETVAAKVTRFAQSRRSITRAMAKQFKVEVPADVERFFDAAEAGRWDELKGLFDSLKQQRQGPGSDEGLRTLWPAILETFGVAEVVHGWPAQKLLDYGESVLDSLRPGMVYVGGTDGGRFIPTLLNETSDGEHHIVLTQNALADATYLQYLGFLYGDNMATLTGEDSQHAFQDYIADAQKRFTHDQQFPEEPKQLRPGEDIQMTENRVQVSGQVAVMAINEKLLETLMSKNPGLSFALQESFPFKSTYPDAAPLGPIMELRTQDVQTTFTANAAAQALDYWRNATQQLPIGSETSEDQEVLRAYSKLATAQAGLLAAHNFSTEAEQTYRLATEICPYSPEAVFSYVNLLVTQQRFAEALPVVETAVRAAPDNQQLRDLLDTLKKKVKGN